MSINKKEVYEFLLYSYFNSTHNPYIAASRRAYRDMCRTLRTKELDTESARKKVEEYLEKRVSGTLDTVQTQDDFDAWHKKSCEDIQKIALPIVMTVGQSQKWLNMFLKYLYILDVQNAHDVFAYLHVPLDNYVFVAATSKLKILAPKKSWSKITDYDNEYMCYQEKLRKKLDKRIPLEWEFISWLEEAKKRSRSNA